MYPVLVLFTALKREFYVFQFLSVRIYSVVYTRMGIYLRADMLSALSTYTDETSRDQKAAFIYLSFLFLPSNKVRHKREAWEEFRLDLCSREHVASLAFSSAVTTT